MVIIIVTSNFDNQYGSHAYKQKLLDYETIARDIFRSKTKLLEKTQLCNLIVRKSKILQKYKEETTTNTYHNLIDTVWLVRKCEKKKFKIKYHKIQRNKEHRDSTRLIEVLISNPHLIMPVISLMKMISYRSNHNLLLITLTYCEIFCLLTLLSISRSDAKLAFSFFHLIENSKRNSLFVSIKLCGSTYLPPKLKVQQNSFLNSTWVWENGFRGLLAYFQGLPHSPHFWNFYLIFVNQLSPIAAGRFSWNGT